MTKVRKALWSDCKDLFELATKDDIRNVSFYPAKIQYKDHKKWFEEILESEKEVIYILEIDNVFAGQLRFSNNNDFLYNRSFN